MNDEIERLGHHSDIASSNKWAILSGAVRNIIMG